MGNFKKYLILELLTSGMVSMTLCLFGPLEIILSQPVEFWFSVKDVLPVVVAFFAIVFVGLVLVFLLCSLINEKTLLITISVVAALGICAYVQGNWTFVNYGSMDGTPIEWSNYHGWAIIDTIIWILLALIVVVLILLKEKTRLVCQYLFALVVGVEAITLCTLAIGNSQTSNLSDFSLEGVGEFELSRNKENVIVIVADAFDGTRFLPILDEEPSFKDAFDGFTFYSDVCGTSLFSEESGINLLTGNQFKPGLSFADNINDAYENTDLYDVLEKNNYDIYLYCEEKMVSSEIAEKAVNQNASKSTIKGYSQEFKAIYKMVAFRYAPHVLKNKFWYSTMEFLSFKGGEARLYENYDVYDYLLDNGVKAEKTDNNIYQFFWIQGPHNPANTDRYCHKIETAVGMESDDYGTSQYEQTIGVVRLFTEVIYSLKAAGVYDNTTIIFTSDHGWNIRPNPLLLVKPANSSGSMKISRAPVSMIEDYVPTLKYYITGEDDGNTIYDLCEDQERERYIYIYDINTSDRTYNSRDKYMFPEGAFYPEIKLGRAMDPSSIWLHAEKGFSYNEVTFIWTEGNESEIKVKIDEKIENLQLEMSYFTYNGEQPVELYINDHLIEKFVANGEETKTFIIPGSLIQDGNVTMKMHYENAVAPCDVTVNSSDDRVLALGLRKIMFTSTEKNADEEQKEINENKPN